MGLTYEKLIERDRKRIEKFNKKPNNINTNDNLSVYYKNSDINVNWDSEKYIDSTIRELLGIKMNLMKESIESLGIEFQNTTQYNKHFIRYNNWMIPGMFDGEPSHEDIDTTISLVYSSYVNADFPIPQQVLEYIIEMFNNGFIYEKRISGLLSSEETLERGKRLVQTMSDAGIGDYAAIAIAGALYVESAWNISKCPEKTEFGGLISQKRYKVNSAGHNWGDAGEGLFGITFWKLKEKIINDSEFKPLQIKYNIPNTFNKYNEDLAGGEVDTMYVANWRGHDFKASGHLSNIELDDWGIVLKLFLKSSKYWENFFKYSDENTVNVSNRDEEYLTGCLAASYLFKAGGNNPTFEEAKNRSSIYRSQHASMGYRVQDGWATQIIISIALSKYIKGESVQGYDDLKQIIFSM